MNKMSVLENRYTFLKAAYDKLSEENRILKELIRELAPEFGVVTYGSSAVECYFCEGIREFGKKNTAIAHDVTCPWVRAQELK